MSAHRHEMMKHVYIYILFFNMLTYLKVKSEHVHCALHSVQCTIYVHMGRYWIFEEFFQPSMISYYWYPWKMLTYNDYLIIAYGNFFKGQLFKLYDTYVSYE